MLQCSFLVVAWSGHQCMHIPWSALDIWSLHSWRRHLSRCGYERLLFLPKLVIQDRVTQSTISVHSERFYSYHSCGHLWCLTPSTARSFQCCHSYRCFRCSSWSFWNCERPRLHSLHDSRRLRCKLLLGLDSFCWLPDHGLQLEHSWTQSKQEEEIGSPKHMLDQSM